MNDHEEILIAEYLAGGEVSEELLNSCKKNPELLKDLAELTAVERLLNFQSKEGSATFANEVMERLKSENDDSFVAGITEKLQKEESRKNIFWIWLAAAACCLLIPVLFLRSPEELKVASVTNSLNAEWGLSTVTKNGFKKGIVKLTRGYAELAMENGTRLLLEGPVELDIKSVDLIHLSSGSLVAVVPETTSTFTLMTPTAEVHQRNNEYAVSVNDSGASEIHVLDGELKIRSRKDKIFVNIAKGEARHFDEFQQMTKINNDPIKFMRALPGKSIDNPEYLHWSFDNVEHLVKCDGPGIKGKHFPGTLKAFKQGKGPKQDKGHFNNSLFFNGKDAYVQTDFRGISSNKPRTVAFWAKVPKDFSINNGYGMVSWGVMKSGGAWQISPNPEIKDGLIGRLRIGTHHGMVIGTTDLRDNKWHHIAIVMYGGISANSSTHILMYIDAILEKTSKKSIAIINTGTDDKNSKPLVFGRNLGFREDHKNKFYRGSLDEIFIFDTALGEAQIKGLMNRNQLPKKSTL
jgi:hypothetical protein